MSRWIRGIYNAAANFNMSNALRSASGRNMGGDTEHVREECNKSDQCKQSCQSSKPIESSEHACACHSARTCNCANGGCADNDGSQRNTCYPDNEQPSNKLNVKHAKHDDGCTCSLCRDYSDYTASIRIEGQGTGSRIRLSDESGSFKRTNSDAADSVERCTGIPTGVTI